MHEDLKRKGSLLDASDRFEAVRFADLVGEIRGARITKTLNENK